MHLSHDVLWVTLGILIVPTNSIVVVNVKSFPNLRNVAQGHGPQVRVPLVHRAIEEKSSETAVIPIVDGVSVFMIHHVGDQRGGVASASEVVKIDAGAVIECVALPVHVDVHRHAEVQICEFRQPCAHVVVNQVGASVGTGFLGVARRR